MNGAISSLNSFFCFTEWHDIRIKSLKIQKQIFSNKDKELTKAEYERLLTVAKAKKNQKLYYLMQTICSTGIRISELRYITISAVKSVQAIGQIGCFLNGCCYGFEYCGVFSVKYPINDKWIFVFPIMIISISNASDLNKSVLPIPFDSGSLS